MNALRAPSEVLVGGRIMWESSLCMRRCANENNSPGSKRKSAKRRRLRHARTLALVTQWWEFLMKWLLNFKSQAAVPNMPAARLYFMRAWINNETRLSFLYTCARGLPNPHGCVGFWGFSASSEQGNLILRAALLRFRARTHFFTFLFRAVSCVGFSQPLSGLCEHKILNNQQKRARATKKCHCAKTFSSRALLVFCLNN